MKYVGIMSDEFSFADNISISKRPDPLARLPALAERLGIAPAPIDGAGSVRLVTESGDAYDLFDLINAFLDKLEPNK